MFNSPLVCYLGDEAENKEKICEDDDDDDDPENRYASLLFFTQELYKNFTRLLFFTKNIEFNQFKLKLKAWFRSTVQLLDNRFIIRTILIIRLPFISINSCSAGKHIQQCLLILGSLSTAIVSVYTFTVAAVTFLSCSGLAWNVESQCFGSKCYIYKTYM